MAVFAIGACPECRAAVLESVFDAHFWPRVATAALPFVVVFGVAWLLARVDLGGSP